MDNLHDFKAIAPFDDSQFGEKMSLLVEEPGFEHAVRYVMPEVDFSDFVKKLLAIPDKQAFHSKISVKLCGRFSRCWLKRLRQA